MDLQKLVDNIQKYCKMKGVDITPACRECGIGHNFFQNIKNGKKPSVEKVQMLAKYLGVTTSELLGEMQPGKEDKTNPEYQELRLLIDCATDSELRTLLDLIKLTKILKSNTLKESEKENSPVQDEAVNEKQYPVFEACEPVDHGTYRCVGCGQDYITIHIDGTKLRPCAVCGEIYWSKIK